MKSVFWLAIILGLFTSGCQQNKQQTPQSQEEKHAYSVGASMARMHQRTLERITDIESDFDVDMYVQGVVDSINGKLQFEEEELKKLSDEYHKLFLAKSNEINEKIAAENLAIGSQFLAENKTKEDVIETESGLQYRIIRQGSGQKPTREDRVEVNYIGRLVDGTEFDNSYTRGKPAQFDLIRVVPGWTEGLQLMQEGAKYKLYVPAELGYGKRASAKIPANSTLVFEVELLKVLDKGGKPKK